MRRSHFCLIGGYCCHQLAKLVQQTSPKAGGELMTLKLNEVIFGNEPMVTLISVCMVFFCGLGDQPTGPKYEVWQVFFSYCAFEAYSRRITLFYFGHFVREHDTINHHIGQRDKITERERKRGRKLKAKRCCQKVAGAHRAAQNDSCGRPVYTRPNLKKLLLHCIRSH